METDSLTTWHQDSVVISGDEVVVGMPQKRSSQKATCNANDAIKSLLLLEGGSSKSQAGGTPKRQAVGFPQVGELDSAADVVHLSGSESESEDENMCVVSDYEGPAPSSSNKISIDDWDEEQHTRLGMCAANLKRLSLGPDRDAPVCIEAKNTSKEQAAKRNVKRPKSTTRKCTPIQIYKWVVPCYNVNKMSKPCLGYKKDQVIAIWVTCKLCKYKSLDFKAFGLKTKTSNCASWSGCVKHVENVHHLHDPKDVKKLSQILKLIEKIWKIGRRGVETGLQGQSMLDECVEEYGRGSAERKRCVANLA